MLYFIFICIFRSVIVSAVDDTLHSKKCAARCVFSMEMKTNQQKYTIERKQGPFNEGGRDHYYEQYTVRSGKTKVKVYGTKR